MCLQSNQCIYGLRSWHIILNYNYNKQLYRRCVGRVGYTFNALILLSDVCNVNEIYIHILEFLLEIVKIIILYYMYVYIFIVHKNNSLFRASLCIPQQVRQREFSVKTLRSPISAQFSMPLHVEW